MYQFLISQANGSYFMFLNDDDQMGPKTVTSFASNPDNNPETATVIGDWNTRNGAREERIEKVVPYAGNTASRPSKCLLQIQDVGFHGLDRSSTLRNGRWIQFKYDSDVLPNLCYPVLFDVILEGSLVFLKGSDARFINQVGHEKHNQSTSFLGLTARPETQAPAQLCHTVDAGVPEWVSGSVRSETWALTVSPNSFQLDEPVSRIDMDTAS